MTLDEEPVRDMSSILEINYHHLVLFPLRKTITGEHNEMHVATRFYHSLV